MKKYILTTVFMMCCLVQVMNAQITEKPEFGKFAITNATIYTVTNGVIENGIVLIDDHIISFAGKNARIPAGYQRIDGTGKHVYPGFIDSMTHLGLIEISAVAVTVDHAEVGDYNPHVLAFTAINPHSAAIPVTRVSGVTNVISAPASGVISGKSTLIDLWGYSPDDMAVKKSAGLHIEWPTAVKSGGWDSKTNEEIEEEYQEDLSELNDFWARAVFYNRMMNEYESNPSNRIRPDKDLKMESMRGVVNNEVPVIISVDREKDILNALDWVSEQSEDLTFIFNGVSEGWRVADELSDAGVPVIVNTLYTPQRPYDNYQRPYQNPGIMAEAGVTILIGSGETENVRNVIYEAGYAAAYGLGREEAIKALTINPAQVWGVADKLGSIEEGKQANLFISDGDPFEPASQVEHVFINGYKIPMTSRQIQLYEEFLDRDAVNK
ncbi:MAG: amidohydrolase family protein [Balneolaceae bacterium]